MQNRLQHRLEQQQAQSIDMSPLLDIVFILLIFFIVTTVFVKETGVDVDKPQALSAQRLEQTAILLAITNEGEVYYDGSHVGVAGVRGIVEQLIQQEEDRPVIVQADQTVPTELLLNVIDEAMLGGVDKVSIAALNP